ncbi:phosphatidylinositol N-acetylglucosaminyltransferase subunit H isoform X3 [Rhinolophus ferrumequinum]|uniref:phosphatidylinositol N-acetylglucosaminyltransferase subunit H isoform X3 n=1 Tax=Rhinolophus ferrumequinum TaxID=59479 RepID=UPI00140F5202|nr:phosphatidylinositol N-acetylglucosaminyltransferase subunit H isoform X3 [Rhinolophus ferrumequinum]
MENEQSFSDICGGRLALQRRYYSPSCREFCLSSPRLSLRSLTVVTSTVWLAAYGLFTVCENSVVLSAAIFITLLGLLGYLHFVKIDQETLLIIDSLGIQMTSSYASGKESTTFIEMDKVKDVIINEAIYMDPVEPHEISQVVPVFQSAKPRLDCLIEVYRSCQEILAHQKAPSTSPQAHQKAPSTSPSIQKASIVSRGK